MVIYNMVNSFCHVYVFLVTGVPRLKVYMTEMYYKVLKKEFGQDCRLLYTDTGLLANLLHIYQLIMKMS